MKRYEVNVGYNDGRNYNKRFSSYQSALDFYTKHSEEKPQNLDMYDRANGDCLAWEVN